MDNIKKSKFSPDIVFQLVQEIERINYQIDLRSPLINEDSNDKINALLETVVIDIKEARADNVKELMYEYNKKKTVRASKENEKQTWSRLTGYEVPKDDKRQ